MSRALGDEREAAARFGEAADAWTRAGVALEVARARSSRAESLLANGEVDAGVREAGEALAMARDLAPSVLPDALRVAALARLAAGNRSETARMASQAAAAARELRRERAEFLALLVVARARGEEEPGIRHRIEHLARKLAGSLEEAREWLASRRPREDDR